MCAGSAQIHLSVLDIAVRSFDETEGVDARIYAKAGDKTDVRSFRTFDRAETAVVGVVHVTHLESCAVAGKTTGAECGETPLVGDLCQRVGLVHELAQLAGAEERVDHGRETPRIDEVGGSELLAVADVHPFANGTGHPVEAYAELVGKLLAYSADATVAQVVDVIHSGLTVD